MQTRVSFILAVGLLLASSILAASNTLSTEDRIKAAFIFQFSQFTHWPDEADQGRQAPFTICVAGNDAIFSALKPLEKRNKSPRKISVKPFTKTAATDCDILYTESRQVNNQVNSAIVKRTPGLLTVSSERGFALNGGMSELTRKDGRIHILINRKPASAAGITFSAKLLEVAKLIETAQPEELP